MARYNKIFAGPVNAVLPQAIETLATEAIAPGSIVTAAGALADDTTVGKVFVAQENYLEMKGVDDAYASGENLIALELLPSLFFNALVATGNNVTVGASLSITAAGTLQIAGTSDFVVATADEAYNNTSGSAQLVRVRPAIGYITPAA